MNKLPVNPVGLFADNERLLYNILCALERIEKRLTPVEETKETAQPEPVVVEEKKQAAPKTVKKGANTNAENVGRNKARKS